MPKRSFVSCRIKTMSFRLNEEIDEYLTFLSHELNTSRQQVLERCILFCVGRPSDVRDLYKRLTELKEAKNGTF